MKVLIITYYWPPAGGSGVQRWLKFAKYLREFDIEPVIYTVDNANYAIEDEKLQEEIPNGIEVIRKDIFEPNKLISFLGSKKKKTSAGFLKPNPGLLGKIAQYVRANYFIPDARKFWIKPSIKYLKNYLKQHPVDLIITTGPPHSLHLIGLQLKQELGVKWVSDFRDPWTEIDYFHHLPLTKKSLNKHRGFETEVLKKSDSVIVVGNEMKRSFQKQSNKVEVITNGYDDEVSSTTNQLDNSFSITHIGMMNADRNPKVFWEAIEELCVENEELKSDLKIRLIGEVSDEVKKNASQLGDIVEFVKYVPHEEVKKYQCSTQVLLLCINNVPSAKGIITGKIFEYLQAKRPILAIGPEEGDAADILKKTQSGKIFGFSNKHDLKEHIAKLYKEYKKEELTVNSSNITQYHRRELTAQLANVIRKTVEEH